MLSEISLGIVLALYRRSRIRTDSFGKLICWIADAEHQPFNRRPFAFDTAKCCNARANKTIEQNSWQMIEDRRAAYHDAAV
jgi:hypothetical protein